MKNLTLRNLTKVCNGIWHGDNALLDQEISAITTDSRKIEKDCLFVPIVGERVDAHQFIPQVMQAGAGVTFSSRKDVAPAVSGCCIYVEDTLAALQKAAAYYRSRFDIPVIGVTGSVGKTTTKEMISAVLEKIPCRKDAGKLEQPDRRGSDDV